MARGYGGWKPYVPVAQRRAKAAQQSARVAKGGAGLAPVRIEGRAIAQSFWGKAWCEHLESFSDYESRLPRGRSYVRNGAVCHLAITAGRIDARVSGTRMYTVTATIGALPPSAWAALKRQCAGAIGTLIELLQGRLSEPVMRVVTHRANGLFPKPGEIAFTCSCPDWAGMCKHVAATLYGIGNRLDQQPELLFLLRAVDPAELLATGLSNAGRASAATPERLADDQLGAIFGIEFDGGPAPPVTTAAPPKAPVPKPQAPVKRTASAGFVATGKAVASLRRKLGLTLSEFARQLSVSAASAQRWEAAGAAPLKLQSRTLAALTALSRR